MNRVFIPAVLLGLLGLACHGSAASTPPAPSEKAAVALEKKLNRLVLPTEPDFASRTLEEAVEYLRVKSRDADIAAGVGINFVIIKGTENLLPESPGLKFKNVPFAEALRHVMELTGMKYRVDTHAVAIAPAEHFKLKRPLLTETDAPTDREKRLLHSLKQSIRPTITFQGTTVEEALEFLRTSYGCLDIGEAELAAKRESINLVLKVRPGSTQPLITIDLKDAPIAEAIFYIAEMSGLKLSLRSSAVVFSDHDLGPPPKAPAKQSQLELRARGIILPAVALQGVSLADSLEFLRLKIHEFDPPSPLKFVVRPGGGSTIRDLTLKEISLLDTLDHIALQTGHRLSVEEETFVLKPAN